MRTLIVMTIVGLSALWCFPAAGQTESAETMLHEGILRFKVGKFSQSTKFLKRALRKAKDPLVKAKIHLYLGLNQGVDGNEARAEKAFKEALKLDPTLNLKKSQTKESILKVFVRARESLTGELSVTADKEGASLYVDGERKGNVPFKGPIPVGRHALEVTTPDGLFGFKGEVLVRAGQAHSMQVMLKPLTGSLKVASDPAGAAVKVNGEDRGETPVELSKLKPGAYEVKLSLPGHKEATRKVQVEAGKDASLQIKLEKMATLPPMSKSPSLRQRGPSPSAARPRFS